MGDPLEGRRVLAIDDSPLVRAVLRKSLAARGAKVETAGTGEVGIDLAGGQPYDLIVLDLNLPDMNGIEVLKKIRGRNATSAVLMLTAASEVKVALASLREGADGFFDKQDMGAGNTPEFHAAVDQALLLRTGIVASEQLNRMKDEFHLLLSNDLRRPVDNVLLGLDSVLAGDLGAISPEQREALEAARAEVHGLRGLISDFLDLSAIEAGRLRLSRTEVGLAELIGLCVETARVQAARREQEVVLDVPSQPVIVEGDIRRLKQVFGILLANAVKYTGRGGRITASLRIEDGQAVARVADTGVGISASLLPRLFSAYASHAGKTQGGTNLELPIVKEIVAAHGGKVDAASEGIPGRGAVLTVSLPLASAVAAG